MSIFPAALQVTAAAAWVGTVTADAAEADARIWVPMLVGAAVTTLPALERSFVSERLDATYAAMARAFIKRQPDPRTPADPWPALHAVQDGGQRRPHGRHASRLPAAA